MLRSRRSAVPGDNVPLAIRRLKMIREEVTTTTTNDDDDDVVAAHA